MKNLVIFASGAGSNAARIMDYFQDDPLVQVAAVFTNKETAGVIALAQARGVAVECFNKGQLESGEVLERVRGYGPDLVVLAGFLLHVPDHLVQAFPDKMVNIHPALLPKYGGQGMYGMHVHRAVLENKERETGISIHFVNEHFDEGEIIRQFSTNVSDCVSPEEIAARVQSLEHEHYPEVIREILAR